MVQLSGETSNQLFEVLSDWNEQLNACEYYQNTEALPFQEIAALPQISADSASNDGELPVETYGDGSCQT